MNMNRVKTLAARRYAPPAGMAVRLPKDTGQALIMTCVCFCCCADTGKI